jgi:flagellar hook-associated protein 2
MSTSSINSLLSSLSSSSNNESISQLLGQNSTSSNTSTNSSANTAIQDAVNAILNSATNTSGSGIDVTSTVDAILQLDAAPEQQLQNQITTLNSQTSALQTLQSDLTAFQTSIQALTDFTGDFGGVSVSSSNNNVVSATAANGTAPGTHTVTVSKLATTSADYSASFSSANAQLPTGQLSLQVGSGSAATIPLNQAQGTNTVSGLETYINSHNFGVTASVITDSTGTRLALESQTSGAAGQITLTDDTSADNSQQFASASAALPTGSFDIQVGSNSAVTIPVDSKDGTNTLTGLASYINNQKNLGVSASVVTTSSGASLALIPQSSGAAGFIAISNDTTGTGDSMGFPSVYPPTISSGEFASGSATLPSGSFDLQVGTNSAVTIPVNSTDGTNTLNGLADYINQQNVGVSASVVTTGAGASLTLAPQNSGEAGEVSVSNDTTANGGGLSFPAAAVGNALAFTDALDGHDAQLTVDGVPVDSGSNTVSGVPPGVTLTLSGESTNPVTIQISPDLNSIGTDINNFVSNWNTLIQAVNSGIQFNSSSSTAGALTGDTSVDFLQQELLSSISSSMTGNNGVVNLQSIGIEMQNDGTLSVDSTTLNDALQNNFSAVQNLFQSTSGVGQALQTSLTSLTNPVSGPLAVDMNGISSEVTDLNSQISEFQLQLQNTQTQLLAEYTTINTTLEQLPQTLASINSQLNALNPQPSS